MEIKIVTPKGVIYDKRAVSITLPTNSGVITVLDDHQPLVSLLTAGEIAIKEEGEDTETLLSVSTGIIEVQPESIIYIMADTAESAEDIDINRAEEAMKRTKEELEKKDTLEDMDFAKLEALIEKEMARIQVGNKFKDLRSR